MSKKKWFPQIDKRIYLSFGIVLFIGIILLIYQQLRHVDCENANFLIKADDYGVNKVIEYFDNTKGATSWEWDFGDNTPVDKRQRTLHRYKKAGDYFVKLTINGSCRHERMITISNINEEVGYLPAIFCPDVAFVGDEVHFDAEKLGGESWEWSFGETGVTDAVSQASVYRFHSPGEKRITLIVNGDVEHAATKTVYVAAKNIPKPKIDLSAYNITKIPSLPLGPREEDPLNILLQHLPVNPVSKRAKKDSLAILKDAPEISTVQFKILLNQVAAQAKAKEDFKEYVCGNYEIPVVVNDDNIMSFERFCESIIGKKIKITVLRTTKDSRNCIQNIYIKYKVKKYFLWVSPIDEQLEN